MIKNLSPRFRVDAFDPPSTEEEIRELKQFSPIPVPDFYINIIRQGTEIELFIDGESYIRIWGASNCLELNPAYGFQESLGPCLAIGDDEGGKELVLIPASSGHPAGMYLISAGALHLDYARYIAESLDDLLINGTGAEKIYD